jgi:hypothetical protein
LEDDLDGSRADQTVIFALEGISYEIDLSDAHANNLRSAFRPYIEAARKVSLSRLRGRRTHERKAPSSVQVRAWSEEQGLPVNARGKIRADVLLPRHGRNALFRPLMQPARDF